MVFISKILKLQLIKQGLIKRYFLYFLGEIILIIAGILVALQINNSNQYRNNRAIEKNDLKALQVELTANHEKIVTSINFAKDKTRVAIELLSFFNPTVLEQKMVKFPKLLFKFFSSDSPYEHNSTVLTEMINSGRLRHVQNITLRRDLFAIGSMVKKIKQQELDENTASMALKTLIITHGSLYPLIRDPKSSSLLEESTYTDIDNSHLFREVKFENLLIDYLLTNATTQQLYFPQMKKKIEHVLMLLEKELQ